MITCKCIWQDYFIGAVRHEFWLAGSHCLHTHITQISASLNMSYTVYCGKNSTMLLFSSWHIRAGRGERVRGDQDKQKGVEDVIKDRVTSRDTWSVLTSDSDSIVAKQCVAVFVSAGVDAWVVVRDVVDVQRLVAQPRAVARQHHATVFLPRDRHQEVGCVTLEV